MPLTPLNFPEYPLKISQKEGQYFVFCLIRKKQILLTPEEWVRQHVVQYLILEKKFPKNLIALEKQITVNDLKKRFDVLCYDKTGNPMMLVECKASHIKITENTFRQIANYNQTLRVPYLLVTNGLSHFMAQVSFSTGEVSFLPQVIDFPE